MSKRDSKPFVFLLVLITVLFALTSISLQRVQASRGVNNLSGFVAAPTTPVVTITATDDTAAEEPGGNTGKFRISRTGGTIGPLTVSYTISGSANNADYTPELSGVATIADGLSFVDITITAVRTLYLKARKHSRLHSATLVVTMLAYPLVRQSTFWTIRRQLRRSSE